MGCSPFLFVNQIKGQIMNLTYDKQVLSELEDINSWIFKKIREKNESFIPKGLENKINIYWFQYFFKQNSPFGESYGDNYFVKEFNSDWLDIPFPNSKRISLDGGYSTKSRVLKGDEYWIELVQIMNDMLIEEGRIFDLGITSVEYIEDKGIVDFCYST